jgi:hypothetical protein
MDTLTSGLNKTGESVESGIRGITSGLSKGVQGLRNAISPSGSQETEGSNSGGGDKANCDSRPVDEVHSRTTTNDTSGPATGSGNAAHAAATNQTHIPGGVFFERIASGVTSGASSILAPTADALKSGATLSRDATRDGFLIGHKIAQSGLDMGSNVATGSATLAGTALGGVVEVAAETSGAVFEPVGSGLKAVEGLNKLGQGGVEAINGLSLGAVKQVGQLTMKALNMSGKVESLSFSYKLVAKAVVACRHPRFLIRMRTLSLRFLTQYVGWSCSA